MSSFQVTLSAPLLRARCSTRQHSRKSNPTCPVRNAGRRHRPRSRPVPRGCAGQTAAVLPLARPCLRNGGIKPVAIKVVREIDNVGHAARMVAVGDGCGKLVPVLVALSLQKRSEIVQLVKACSRLQTLGQRVDRRRILRLRSYLFRTVIQFSRFE